MGETDLSLQVFGQLFAKLHVFNCGFVF